jgi:hypothetical protein
MDATQEQLAHNALELKQQNENRIARVRVRVLPDGRLDRKNCARYLGVSVKTLADWVYRGVGPPSVLMGRRRYYYIEDLDDFIAGRKPKRK